jgi:hypothetical protein
MTALILHTLEAQSVRVSAQLDARPELGALWRRLVAVSEASANLSMEDTPVPEQDILMPDLGSAMITGDPQSAQVARVIHNFLIRPGNILDAPGNVFDRARDAGRLTSIADEQDGGRIPQLSAAEKMDWDWARRDFEQLTRQILRHEAPVIFRLLAFSGAVSQILPERSPIMERLIFMAAESTLRRQESLSDLTVGFMARDTDTRISAHWTMTPAMALSREGFRAWSPASASGETELAERLLSALKFNVGRLGQIHKWMAEINQFKGKTRKSRHQDLAQLILVCPIISADVAASRLGITARATRDLIDEASQRGLLQLMTPRRNYRLWAVPALAEMIRDKPQSGKSRNTLASLRDQSPAREPGPGHNLPRNEEALLAAEQELDRAMAHADRILARFRRDITAQE